MNIKQSSRFILTSRLEQYNIVNEKSQDLGRVQNMVIDMVAGRIAFVIVAFMSLVGQKGGGKRGGLLGISDKWFAMPWEILAWRPEKKRFFLDIKKEVLEKAPGMHKENWLEEIDMDWLAKNYNYYGRLPYWGSSIVGEKLKQSSRFIPTNRLEQYNIVNEKGQDLGRVQNMVIDMVAGRIAFVIVAFMSLVGQKGGGKRGGLLGISDKWFAMPWEILAWRPEKKRFFLDIKKEVLEKAPGMHKENWLEEIDMDWLAKNYNYYGRLPYWGSSIVGEKLKQSSRFIPTNRLEQYNIVNEKGQDLGRVQNLVIDMVAGRIAFVVVTFMSLGVGQELEGKGILGLSDKWFAMPWEILAWRPEHRKFILDIKRGVLEKAPGMDKDKWTEEIDLKWLASNYNYYGRLPYWESSIVGENEKK